MAVLLPNAQLTALVRAHPAPRDAHGTPLPNPPTITRGPFPSGIKERPDAGTWSLRLDTRMWPLEESDEVTDGIRTWVLLAEPQLHTVPGIDAVDYIQARGVLAVPEVP